MMSKVRALDHTPARLGKALGWWIRHAASHPNITETLRDFQIWTRTSILRADLMDHGLPWLPFSVTRWLNLHLDPCMRVFEWGSGASTVFFGGRVSQVVSIEYNPDWYARVSREVANRSLTNVTLCHVPPEDQRQALELASPDDLSRYSTGDRENRGRFFVSYVRAILKHPEESFDVVVVDGRTRPECMRTCASRVKPGGIVVLDDSQRAEYAGAVAHFAAEGWRITRFSGPGPGKIWPPFWEATVLVKPRKTE